MTVRVLEKKLNVDKVNLIEMLLCQITALVNFLVFYLLAEVDILVAISIQSLKIVKMIFGFRMMIVQIKSLEEIVLFGIYSSKVRGLCQTL